LIGDYADGNIDATTATTVYVFDSIPASYGDVYVTRMVGIIESATYSVTSSWYGSVAAATDVYAEVKVYRPDRYPDPVHPAEYAANTGRLMYRFNSNADIAGQASIINSASAMLRADFWFANIYGNPTPLVLDRSNGDCIMVTFSGDLSGITRNRFYFYGYMRP